MVNPGFIFFHFFVGAVCCRLNLRGDWGVCNLNDFGGFVVMRNVLVLESVWLFGIFNDMNMIIWGSGLTVLWSDYSLFYFLAMYHI